MTETPDAAPDSASEVAQGTTPDLPSGHASTGAPGPWEVARYMASVNPVMLSTRMRIVDTREGYAELAMFIGPEYGNTYGVCHGGIVFSLADMCFGLAANSYNERCVTASADIQYISPGNVGADMTAVATETWRGKRSAIYDVHVRNADGATAALLRVKGRILGGPVVPPPGQDKPEQLGTSGN